MTAKKPDLHDLQNMTAEELSQILTPEQIDKLSSMRDEVHAADACKRLLEWQEEVAEITKRLGIESVLTEAGIGLQILPTILKMRKDAIANLVKSRLKSKAEAMRRGKKQGSRQRRYVNPNNPALEWSGRGARPKWLKEYLAGGGNLADLEAK